MFLTYFRVLFVPSGINSTIGNYLIVSPYSSLSIMTCGKMFNFLIIQSAPFIILICACLYCSNAYGYPSINDNNISVERYATGLNHPTTMAFLGDNDVLILEKDNGTIVRLKDGELFPFFDVEVANDKELRNARNRCSKAIL